MDKLREFVCRFKQVTIVPDLAHFDSDFFSFSVKVYYALRNCYASEISGLHQIIEH